MMFATMDALRQSIRAAAERPEVRAAVNDLYARVQQKVDARRPVCAVSGRCCRFEEYGHRLYVTTLELAAFVHEFDQARSQGRVPPADGWDGTGCPFQVSKLCGVHPFRPFGCRMFFCDATSTGWQNEAYERFHAELKHLHETMGVPYAYVEWRQALRAIGLGLDSAERDSQASRLHVERAHLPILNPEA
jgi:Fe-S-cluster containining protein